MANDIFLRGAVGGDGPHDIRLYTDAADAGGGSVHRAPTFVPLASPSRHVSSLTWLHSAILPLMAAAALAAPFTPAWATQPNSLPKPAYAQHQVTGPNLVLTAQVETPPFKQTHWVNPVRPAAPISEVRGLTLSLLPQAEASRPFTQIDWANPLAPEPFKQDALGSNVLVLHATPPEEPPFKQTAWVVPPPPIVPPPPSIYRPQAEEAAVVGRPFVQTNWANPWVPKYAAPLFEPQRYALPFTLTPPSVDPPFKQTSWPNPIAPPLTRQPQPGQGFEIVYKPVMQNDWPLPWFPPPVKHEVGRNLTILLAGVPPEERSPARWNWVNPIYPPPVKHDVIGTNVDVLHDMTNVPRPFTFTGWVNPWMPPPFKHDVIGINRDVLALPPVNDKLFIDVDTGEIWMRLNATSPYIIKVT